MSSYKAIVFDLDGTAIPNSWDGFPSRRLVDTITKYQNRIQMFAATGRTPSYALPIIKALQITNLCVISGGTVIIDPTSGNIIHRTYLAPTAVTAILAILETHPYKITLDDDPVHVSDITARIHRTKHVGIIFVGQVPAATAIALKQTFETIPDVAASLAPDWSGENFAMLITHRNATKEQAVAKVLSALKIHPDQAIGVGDGDNDIHLFNSVGLKVAMGNATPGLKAVADVIALPVNEDGLAAIIEQYA